MNLIRFVFTKQFILNFFGALLLLFCFVLFISKIWLPIRTQHGEVVAIPPLDKLNLFKALEMLDEKELTYKIDTFRYDEKIPAHQIMYVYPKSGSEVKKGRAILIKANAKTWRPVFLPNLINNSKRLAFTKIKAADLFVGDTIYEPDLAKDVVKRILYNGREVKSGEMIPRYAKIDVVLGKGLKTNVLTPTIEGLTLEQAKYVIKQNQFEIGKIKYLFRKNKDTTNLKVYYQDPAPEDFIDEGMPIHLWVSNISVDSLKNQINTLHKTYRKYLLDSLGRLMTTGEIKQATQKVLDEAKKPMLEEQQKEIEKSTEEGISIE
jgi:eukaryotic-like serine/threonine-protein kinase